MVGQFKNGLITIMNKFQNAKRELQKSLSNIDLSVGNARKQEKELQEKIARLLEREAKLTEKKKNLESRKDALSEKLGKVKKIKYELEEV